MKLLTPKDERSLLDAMLNALNRHHRLERAKRWVEWALLALAVVFIVQYFRGVRDEYDGMRDKLAAMEVRAKHAEDQLKIMLKNGDCGILLATFQTDMGPTQLRVVPVAR